MPNIQGLPEHLQSAPGVQMNPPPAEYIDQTMGVISAAVEKLADGEKGKLVWIATTNGSQWAVNAAVVNKINNHVTVSAWIGKQWNTPIAAGIVGEVRW